MIFELNSSAAPASGLRKYLIAEYYRWLYAKCTETPSPCISSGLRSPWALAADSRLLIEALPPPSEASQLVKECVLEEVRTGYLEFLFRHEWAGDLSFGEAIASLGVFSPTASELKVLRKMSFFRYTAQAKR